MLSFHYFLNDYKRGHWMAGPGSESKPDASVPQGLPFPLWLRRLRKKRLG